MYINKKYMIVGVVVVVLLIAAGAGAYFLWGRGGAEHAAKGLVSTDVAENVKLGATTTVEVANPDEFKKNYRDSFAQSCEKAANGAKAAESVCTCVADYLTSNYEVQQLADISSEMVKDKVTGTLPQAITDAVKFCRPDAVKQ